MNERVSYWLVPAEPARTELARLIRGLAERFGAPPFTPHVTLYSGALDRDDDVTGILRGALRGTRGVSLEVCGIGHSDEFTRTLFLELTTREALRCINSELKRQSRQPGAYSLQPHLSLIYAPLASETRERLAREIVVPRSIHFDSALAIASTGPTRQRSDVEAWRVIAEQNLH